MRHGLSTAPHQNLTKSGQAPEALFFSFFVGIDQGPGFVLGRGDDDLGIRVLELVDAIALDAVELHASGQWRLVFA